MFGSGILFCLTNPGAVEIGIGVVAGMCKVAKTVVVVVVGSPSSGKTVICSMPRLGANLVVEVVAEAGTGSRPIEAGRRNKSKRGCTDAPLTAMHIPMGCAVSRHGGRGSSSSRELGGLAFLVLRDVSDRAVVVEVRVRTTREF